MEHVVLRGACGPHSVVCADSGLQVGGRPPAALVSRGLVGGNGFQMIFLPRSAEITGWGERETLRPFHPRH